MRTLSAAVLAAQRSLTARPYVRVEVVEKLGAAARFRWSRLYSGSEPDCPNDATVPGDGSLVRIRGGGGIYRQRVADPGPGSDFSPWYYWGFTGSDVAVCSHGAEVLAFWVQSSGWLRRRESSSYGETWEDPLHMNYLGGDYGSYHVAACFKDNGDAIALYCNGATVYRRRRINGMWETASAWTNSLNAVAGMAVTHSGDWNVVVTGMNHDGRAGVWTCVLGDGHTMPVDSWSSLEAVTIASPDSDTCFCAPSIDLPDVFRAFFVERYAGAEAYSRPCWSHSLPSADFISNLWREPVPFDLACQHGVALTHSGSYAWLCAPSGVWRSPLSPPSVDVTNDTIEVRTGIGPASGSLQLTLRNDDGRFNSLGSGSYAPIGKGAKVLLHLGYHTGEGAESSPAPAFWIEGWEYATGGGRSHLIVRAHDGWSLLQRWRARRQFAWPKGERNIFQLLRFLFSRAGLEFSSFSYSDAVLQCPAFTIHPEESALTAVRRLLDMVPDVILFVADTAYLVNPRASDASCYSYGTDHAVLEGRYTTGAQAANRVQVFGETAVTEDWDWDEVEQVYDRLAQARDLNLDATDKAHQRGQAILRAVEMESRGGHIVVPMNCGQDLYDVVDITAHEAGLDAARRRVLRLEHAWQPVAGRYVLRLGLGAP